MIKNKKKVLIIGCSSTLGVELLVQFRDKGYDVYGTYHNHRPNVENVRLFSFDIERDILKKTYLDVDTIVICIGISISKKISEYTDVNIKKLFTVNVLGQIKSMVKILPTLNAGTKIIYVGSLNSILPLPGYSFYTASKAALLHLVIAMRYELAPLFQVGVVLPGAFRGKDIKESTASNVPLRERSLLLKKLLPIYDVDRVAKKIISVSEMNKVPVVTHIGIDSNVVNVLTRLAPWKLIDWLYTKLWVKSITGQH